VNATARYTTGAAAFLALHDAALPQVDELCGCFHVHLGLQAAGFAVDQEDVALIAGSSQSPTRSKDALPAGETGRDARCAFPILDEAISGTGAAGLVRATERLSGGALVATPVSGPFDERSVGEILRVARDHDATQVIANVATSKLWGSHPTAAQVAAFLESGVDDGPGPDWSVGHFVTLVGTIEGRAGTLVVVADTYPSLGQRAVYQQPLARVASALARDGYPGDGGVLVLASAASAPALATALADAGLTVGTWDNGSPDLGEAPAQ
jgi:hypothetical protein